MANPGDPPGWQPDPAKPGMLRWWNGLGWSDAHRNADATMERLRDQVQGAASSSTITPQQVARSTAAGRAGRAAQVGTVAGTAVRAANPLAGAAMVLGVLSLVFGLVVVLPVIGVIVSLAGLARSRRLASEGGERTGLGRSLTGLVLSTVSLIGWLPSVVQVASDVVQGFATS